MDEGPSIELTLRTSGSYPEVRRRQLRPWLVRLMAKLAPEGGSLGVLFTGDRRMAQLNREFRHQPSTTDVLSFPGQVTAEGRHLGDVVISVPAARRQAAAAGHPPERELRILLLHGLLHCLGHDHETDGGAMERLERGLRREWIDER